MKNKLLPLKRVVKERNETRKTLSAEILENMKKLRP